MRTPSVRALLLAVVTSVLAALPAGWRREEAAVHGFAWAAERLKDVKEKRAFEAASDATAVAEELGRLQAHRSHEGSPLSSRSS